MTNPWMNLRGRRQRNWQLLGQHIDGNVTCRLVQPVFCVLGETWGGGHRCSVDVCLSHPRDQKVLPMLHYCNSCSTNILVLRWRWKHHAPPKRRCLFTKPNGVTYQKTITYCCQWLWGLRLTCAAVCAGERRQSFVSDHSPMYSC